MIYKQNVANFQFNYSFFQSACSLVMGMGVIVPITVWACLQIHAVEVDMTMVYCIYGYSMLIWIPISILCEIPEPYLVFILLIYGIVHSSYFCVKTYWRQFEIGKDMSLQTQRQLTGILIILQLIFGLSIRYTFYEQITENIVTNMIQMLSASFFAPTVILPIIKKSHQLVRKIKQ